MDKTINIDEKKHRVQGYLDTDYYLRWSELCGGLGPTPTLMMVIDKFNPKKSKPKYNEKTIFDK